MSHEKDKASKTNKKRRDDNYISEFQFLDLVRECIGLDPLSSYSAAEKRGGKTNLKKKKLLN